MEVRMVVIYMASQFIWVVLRTRDFYCCHFITEHIHGWGGWNAIRYHILDPPQSNIRYHAFAKKNQISGLRKTDIRY